MSEPTAVDSLRNVAGNVAGNVTDALKNPTQTLQSLGSSITNASSTVKDSLNNFSSAASAGLGSASASFLDSNSLVAKFAFLFLVILVFMSLFYILVKLITYFTTSPAKNVAIVSGLISGSDKLQLSQNPQTTDSATVYRSNNARSGMEFTWSVWLYVSSAEVSGDSSGYNHVFHKGGNKCGAAGVATVNNAPGLYVSSANGVASLNVFMDTVKTSASTSAPVLKVDNIPLNKWFHVAIRMQNNILDIYLNGTISGRYQFTDVPKQNYDDIFVSGVDRNNGFSGKLSNLYYYNRALGVFELNNILMAGPSLTQSSTINKEASLGYYGYMSNMWYNSNQVRSQPAGM
jgi:hypothetical protein